MEVAVNMSERYLEKRIAVSGGFDPIHIGHIRLFRSAKELVGDKGELIVILNGDNWLIRKKGKRFMKENERAEVLASIRYVDKVYIHQSDDDHVIEALRALHPDVFANGGDRKSEKDIPESAVCKELGIAMVFFDVGEDAKDHSSSALLREYSAKA